VGNATGTKKDVEVTVLKHVQGLLRSSGTVVPKNPTPVREALGKQKKSKVFSPDTG